MDSHNHLRVLKAKLLNLSLPGFSRTAVNSHLPRDLGDNTKAHRKRGEAHWSHLIPSDRIPHLESRDHFIGSSLWKMQLSLDCGDNRITARITTKKIIEMSTFNSLIDWCISFASINMLKMQILEQQQQQNNSAPGPHPQIQR